MIEKAIKTKRYKYALLVVELTCEYGLFVKLARWDGHNLFIY